MVKNRSLILLQEPEGMPQLDRDFAYRDLEIDLDQVPKDGLVLKSVAMAIDPTLRNSMRLSTPKPYAPLYIKGQTIWGFGVSEVIKSDNPQWKQGDILWSPRTQMSTYWTLSSEQIKDPSRALNKIDPLPDLNITTYVSALGMPGMTAYMSIKDIIGDFKPNSTLFVTSGAGFVGSLVIQMAKQSGVRVIASAGSEEKVKFLREKVGADVAFNYKTADIDAELASFGGEKGIEYMYDNVGGKQLNSYLAHSAVGGTVIVCGVISAYNATEQNPAEAVPLFPSALLTRQLTVRGFIVFSMFAKWKEAFWRDVPQMVRDGKFKSQEDVRVGINELDKGFTDLLTGNHQGKVVVLMDDERKDKWIPRPTDGFAA